MRMFTSNCRLSKLTIQALHGCSTSSRDQIMRERERTAYFSSRERWPHLLCMKRRALLLVRRHLLDGWLGGHSSSFSHALAIFRFPSPFPMSLTLVPTSPALIPPFRESYLCPNGTSAKALVISRIKFPMHL